MKYITLAFALGGLLCSRLVFAQTIDFSDLTHPVTGVGSQHPAYTQNGFSLLRIADPTDPNTDNNHFHTIAGSNNKTSADFFSDDGAPFLYFFGPILGTDPANYTAGTGTAFNLQSFTVFQLNGEFTLTSSLGATQVIDHAGTYTFGAGFAGISGFQHDYTGSTDGNMILDSLTFKPTTYRTISGAISLEGAPNAVLLPVHIELRAPGSLTPLLTYDVPAGGAFTLSHVPDSVYDLAFKGMNTLRRVVPNVSLTNGPVSGLVIALPAGDANGDNVCDTSDFNLLVGAFGSVYNPNSPNPVTGYDPKADFNEDGSVDTTDFNLLVGSFGEAGDN